jgi:hypothetical protein
MGLLRMSSCRFDLESKCMGFISTETKQKRKYVKRVRVDKIIQPEPNALVFGNEIDIEGRRVVLTLPLKTVSEGNCFETWQKKHARHKIQKKAVVIAMIQVRQHLQLPCKLTFVRYAPRELDRQDNLPMSQKWICDQTCAELTGDFRPGRADNDKRISFAYDQVKSKEYGVKIIIEF